MEWDNPVVVLIMLVAALAALLWVSGSEAGTLTTDRAARQAVIELQPETTPPAQLECVEVLRRGAAMVCVTRMQWEELHCRSRDRKCPWGFVW